MSKRSAVYEAPQIFDFKISIKPIIKSLFGYNLDGVNHNCAEYLETDVKLKWQGKTATVKCNLKLLLESNSSNQMQRDLAIEFFSTLLIHHTSKDNLWGEIDHHPVSTSTVSVVNTLFNLRRVSTLTGRGRRQLTSSEPETDHLLIVCLLPFTNNLKLTFYLIGNAYIDQIRVRMKFGVLMNNLKNQRKLMKLS